MHDTNLNLILRAIIVIAVIYIALQVFGITLPVYGGLILLIIALLLIFTV